MKPAPSVRQSVSQSLLGLEDDETVDFAMSSSFYILSSNPKNISKK